MIPINTAVVLYPFLTALAAAALITPVTIFLMKRFNMVDDPKLHKHPGIIHNKIIPRGGGLALYLGAFIAALIYIPMNASMIAVFFAGFLALVIGLIDDKLNAKSRDVSPYLRFLVNILTAIIVVGSGVSIKFITDPFGGIFHLNTLHIVLPIVNHAILLSDVISVIWLIWVMNMLNWSKGVDGQMPGIVAISAIIIGIVSLKLNNTGIGNFADAKLSFIIAGSSLGFLVYNFYPARIFPGYGATSLYLLLGVASILTSAKLATAILVMGVPTVDALFIIIRRILHKKSPFKGDKNHLHHILLKLGWGQRKIALFYWLISAILGLISLNLTSKSKVFAIIMVIVLTGGTLFFLHTINKDVNDKITS